MGSSLSTQRRSERRRSNRLSKPPKNTRSANFLKPTACETESNESHSTRSGSVVWRNQWTGELSPEISAEIKCDQQRRVHSFPSYSFNDFEHSRATANGSRRRSNTADRVGEYSYQLSRSGSQTSNFPAGRLSFLRGRPKRGHSFRSVPQGVQDVVQERPMEGGTYRDDYFSPDVQHFSLIRRKSLLTPGIATRTPDVIYRRPPSPTSQESGNMYNNPIEVSRSSQWPLCDTHCFSPGSPVPVPSFARASTPNEREYSHLGGLKLGSLRIVNGSPSPSPSDRTRSYRRDRSTFERDDESNGDIEERRNNNAFPLPEKSPSETMRPGPHGIRRAELSDSGMVRSSSPQRFEPVDTADNEPPSDHQAMLKPAWKKRSTSTLEVPLAGEVKGQEFDIPESAFAFEKSQTTVTPPKQSVFFLGHSEDEGVAFSDNEDLHGNEIDRYNLSITGLEEAAVQDSISRLGRRASRPLNKTDSGYGSETSIRSLQMSRTRGSGDPRISQQCHPCSSTQFQYDFTGDQDANSDSDVGESQTEPSLSRSRLRIFEAEDSLPEMQQVTQQDQCQHSVAMSTMCHERQDVGHLRS